MAKAKSDCKLHCCALTDADRDRIRGTLTGWEAGKGAIERGYGPTCTCTLAAAKEPCILHGTPSTGDV